VREALQSTQHPPDFQAEPAAQRIALIEAGLEV